MEEIENLADSADVDTTALTLSPVLKTAGSPLNITGLIFMRDRGTRSRSRNDAGCEANAENSSDSKAPVLSKVASAHTVTGLSCLSLPRLEFAEATKRDAIARVLANVRE